MNSPTLTAPATQLGHDHRHRRLHGAGAGARQGRRSTRGHLGVWVVLYEMLTGVRAFEGDDVSTTLGERVEGRAASGKRCPPDLPSPLTRLLRRCLEKDPRRRLSAIGDARLELDEHEPVAAAPQVPAPAPAAIAAVAALASGRRHRRDRGCGCAAVAVTSAPPTDQRVQRLSILPPPGEQVYPDSTGIAVSPDGTMVAFIVGSVARSENELWVRSIGSMSARRLEGTESARPRVLVA